MNSGCTQGAVEVLQRALVGDKAAVLAVGHTDGLVDHAAGLQTVGNVELDIAQFLQQIIDLLGAAPGHVGLGVGCTTKTVQACSKRNRSLVFEKGTYWLGHCAVDDNCWPLDYTGWRTP